MPLSSQLHTPALMGDDEHSIKYGCDPDMYEDAAEPQEVETGVHITMAKRKDDGKPGVLLATFDKAHFDEKKAGAWLAAQKYSIEPADLHSVKGVEIFSTGLWNGKQIDDKDLDHIVEAFSSTRGVVRPFLKLGHDDEQKLVQQDGLPAAGWVENVRKVGSKLVADFVDIPRKIYQLIQNRAYRKVSCEIYNNIDINGAKYPKMLGAVALLGSDLPGVLNLSDILSLYSIGVGQPAIEKFAGSSAAVIISTSTTTSTSNEAGDDQMSQEDLDLFKSKLADAEKDLAAAKAQASEKDAEIEKYKKQAEEAQAQVLASAAKEKAAKVDAFMTEVQAEKLCSKSMAPFVKALVEDEKETYSVGEQKDLSKAALVKEVLKFAKEAAKVNFEETTKDEESTERKDLDSLVQKYAADNKVSYSAAYRVVTKDKDLSAKALYQEEIDA